MNNTTQLKQSRRKAATLLLLIGLGWLTGCTTYEHRSMSPEAGYTGDTTPLTRDPKDSLAMFVLKSGYGRVPFPIKDVKATKQGKQSGGDYLGAAGVGLLKGGLVGAVGMMGMIGVNEAGVSWMKKKPQMLIWLPADDLDIENWTEIRRRVVDDYVAPAAQAFIDSPLAQALQPTPTLIGFLETDPDYVGLGRGLYGSGAWCNVMNDPGFKKPKAMKKCPITGYDEIVPVRYATPESLPFTPSDNTQRYIIARVTDYNFRLLGALPFLQKPNVFTYIPKLDYTIKYTAPYTEKRLGSRHVPVIYEHSTGKEHVFVKPQTT